MEKLYKVGIFMNKFEKCIPFILEAEGGLVDDPHDPGGITKYGVSLRAYKAQYPSANKETIRNLSLSDAKRFYNSFYFMASSADVLPLPVSLVVFDSAINCGPAVAKKMLQRALKVDDDGIVGPKTFAALEKADVEELVAEYTTERCIYYSGLCSPLDTDSPDRVKTKLLRRRKYLRGWLRRANKMMLNAIKLGQGK